MRHAPQSGLGWLLAIGIFFAAAAVIGFVLHKLRDDDDHAD